MQNAIPSRVQNFLQKLPPFSLLSGEDLMHISENVVVKYLQSGEVVFHQNEKPTAYFYVINQGAVHLIRVGGMDEELVEVCDEGDLFGVRPLMAGESYLLSARASEETLLYAIHFESIKKLIEDHPKVAWYLAQNFAAGFHRKFKQSANERYMQNQQSLIEPNRQFTELQSIKHSKAPVTCLNHQTIREAAFLMKHNSVGSIIIVNEAQHPMGILTDRDLRNEVVTGRFPLSSPVSEIMSSPVITISPDLTVADVQIEMMRHNIHHLCLTENGRTDSKVIGVISEHDLLVIQGNHPAIFIREMKRCKNGDDLKGVREKAENLLYQYLLQEVSIHFIAKIMTEVNDALIANAIEMSVQELESEGQMMKDLRWCWMALGSEGREEQLLRTDQDSGLVFEDVPNDQYVQTQQYFLALAQKTNAILNHCGFEYCPSKMMASNEKWCMSLSKWKRQFSSWIKEPTEENVMFCTIFFDFRAIYGDASLTEQLGESILQTIDRKSIFLNFLAKDAIGNPPPLTFFRNFMVEKGGAHKDAFDIKTRAMMPLADAARLLILDAAQPQINNTFKRFDHLAELEPQNAALFEQAADAYEILMRYRALQGLKNKDSGRFFDPAELTKMERLNLRNCFRPINDLQELIKVRFQLSMMM